MDTYPYFCIRFIEGGKHRTQLAEIDWVIPQMIEIKKRGARIIDVLDNFEKRHTEEEMFANFKETIDIEYEDIETMEEAYQKAHQYFDNLYEKNVLYEKEYKEYIKELDKLKEEVKKVDKFIEKIKLLYVS